MWESLNERHFRICSESFENVKSTSAPRTGRHVEFSDDLLLSELNQNRTIREKMDASQTMVHQLQQLIGSGLNLENGFHFRQASYKTSVDICTYQHPF